MRSLTFLTGSLLSLTLVTAIAAVSLGAGQVASATALVSPREQLEQVWLWPLEGEHSIRLGYQAPVTEYARGHRGIDLPADVGQQILAPAAGIVTYTGELAGRGVLSIRYGEYLLSFESLASAVTEGDAVVRGQVLGTVTAGTHCDECLHVGLRRKGLYLSPLKVLGSLPKARLEAWDGAHWNEASRNEAPN